MMARFDGASAGLRLFDEVADAIDAVVAAVVGDRFGIDAAVGGNASLGTSITASTGALKNS